MPRKHRIDPRLQNVRIEFAEDAISFDQFMREWAKRMAHKLADEMEAKMKQERSSAWSL